MKFEYSPAIPDDWPSAIAVTASGVEEGCGIEEGETRFYEPNWKHRVAGNTIREQREKIEELQGFFKQCASRYSDVFEACGMKAPAIFTPKQHEELLSEIGDMRAAIRTAMFAIEHDRQLTSDEWEDIEATANRVGIEVPDEVER